MGNLFTQVAFTKPKRSKFNLSHDRKFSLDMGQLVPILAQEVVPGDKFEISQSHMMRLAPMVSPVMHEVNVFTHYWFVPNRILWEGWEDFITGGETGLDTQVPPFISDFAVNNGSLADYMGLPLGEIDVNEKINALPFAAYQMIYDEFYRDQNLMPKLNIKLEDGNNSLLEPILTQLRRRAWGHDYFTSALPSPQKGQPVTIPLGTTADIYYQHTGYPDQIRDVNGDLVPSYNPDADFLVNKDNDLHSYAIDQGTLDKDTPASIDNSDKLKVDLTSATASTITDLRTAFKLQEWFEKAMRGGSRYAENILSFFGVRSSDSRLQRPEFLGGSSSPIMISEVLQTSDTQSNTPQGNMAGHGLGLGKSGGIDKYAEEHGWIIGIMSVIPKTSYQQGIPRAFSKLDKFDYFWPQFQHIGEQAILNKELYYDANDNPEINNAPFGYIPRYSEYKYIPSTVHGDFKLSLDFWHMGRIFDQRPTLTEEFISSYPTTRIFAVEESEEQRLYCHLFHNIQASRLMEYNPDPRLK